jgi:tetratricopeptide (TPR) repeat protein
MNGLDGLFTRNLTRSVAAHAIRHDVQPQVVVDQKGVFVQFSALANIGQSRTVVLQIVLFGEWRPPTGPGSIRLAKKGVLHQEEGGKLLRSARMNTEAADDLSSTWQELLQRRSQLRTDPELAGLALALIREMGNTIAHREVLHDLANAWTTSWRVMLSATSMLVEQAGRRGMDEPPISDDGPAWWAAAGLARAIESLNEEEGHDPEIAGNLHAMLGNALRLCGPSRDEEAREAFTRAIELDPDRGEWWYDAGLLDKWRGRFDDAFSANELARMHMGPERPVLWNLAICATAIGKAEEAVEAWRQLGVDARIDHGRDMPYVANLPPLLLRVLSRTPATDATSRVPASSVGFELVWVAPLSPCHGVVQSPTFRDAPIDYGDLVLWDGAPVAAHETVEHGPLPVFPLLEILRHGTERRYPFVALEREPDALEGLEAELPEGTRVFIQQERVQHGCAACAAGEPHEHDGAASTSAAPQAPGAPGLVRGKVIVQGFQNLDDFRDSWETALGKRAVSMAIPALYEQLQDTKRAGQEHQAWRGIEGKALRQKAQR